MKKILVTGIIIILLLTNITIISAKNSEESGKLNDEEIVEDNSILLPEIPKYYLPNLDFSEQTYETGTVTQEDDDVELLWNHSGDGDYVFTTFINDDDIPDILASSYAINGVNGATFFQFEKGQVIGVNDVFGDNKNEIISYEDHRINNEINSTIYCLNSSNGLVIWERVIDSVWIFSVSIDNVTGDEKNEVIVGASDNPERNNNYIYCLNGNDGTIIWRKHVNDYVQITAIDDVNADGKNEILAGTRSNDPRLYCLNGDTGDVIWEIVKQVGTVAFRNICIGELNQDSYKEIIVDLFENDEYGILCISGNNGSILWDWNMEPDGEGYINLGSFQSFLIADMIPSNPGNEVLAGGVCGVYCLYSDINPPFGERVIWHAGRANEIVMTFVMSMAVGDLDNDGLPDVVALTIPWVSGEGNVYALQGQYGSLLWMHEDCTAGSFHAILCENLTGDETPEVIVKDIYDLRVLLNTFPTNNQNPNIPSIDGPNFGYIYLSYNYTAITTDPDYDDLYYYFDWGDGTRSTSMVGGSGEIVITPNKWDVEGSYSIKAKTIDEHGAESNWSDTLDVLMIYVSSTVDITRPGNALYINNREIMPNSFPKIFGKIDICANATDNIYGITQVEFYIDDELKTTDFSSPYSWSWDEAGSGNHTIKVVAINEPGIKETAEIVVWKSNGGSVADQIQTEKNGGSVVAGVYDGGQYKNFTVAQSFIPTKKIITKIYLYIVKLGTFNDYVLSIKDNITGESIGSAIVSRKDIGYKYSWVGFDFGELEVNPGQSYYMVSFVNRELPLSGGYAWSHFNSDVYPYGNKYAYFPELYRWLEFPNADMSFKVYGRDSLLPIPPTITGPIVGESEVEYSFTFNAIDPEGDNLYYFIEWGDNTYDEWIGPYSSGENVYLSHSWMNLGIYEINAIVKDEWGLLSDWSESFIINIDMPYEPSNPNPEDGCRIGVNADNPVWPNILLSWHGGDPNIQDLVYYDIYFGQNPDNLPIIDTIGPFFSFQTQIGPYDLGVIDSEGTYYWKIVARDNQGNEMESSTWEFTIYLYYTPSQPSQSTPQGQQPSSQPSSPASTTTTNPNKN